MRTDWSKLWASFKKIEAFPYNYYLEKPLTDSIACSYQYSAVFSVKSWIWISKIPLQNKGKEYSYPENFGCLKYGTCYNRNLRIFKWIFSDLNRNCITHNLTDRIFRIRSLQNI